MAHVAKYTKSAVGHMFNHYGRSEEENSNVIRGNENINPEKTHLNYNLAPNHDGGQLGFLHKRLSEVRCQNRKDVNVVCNWVLTAPKDLHKAEHEKFFQTSYDFLSKKYGIENVVSAWVHMDETTPHMHFAFMPITEDKKRGGFKVSAKEVITRHDLQTFHQDLQTYLEHELGHEVGILNEATKEGNRSIAELKRQNATERLQEVAVKASKIVFKAEKEAEAIKDTLIPLKAEYEAKKAFIRQADKVADVSTMYPKEAKVTEKGILNKQRFVTVPQEMWEAKHVSANEKSCLKEANEALEENLKEFQKTASSKNLAMLTKRCEELEHKNSSLSSQNRYLEQKLAKAEHNAEKTTEKIMDRINRVLDSLPLTIAEAFINAWNKDKQRNQEKNFDREK